MLFRSSAAICGAVVALAVSVAVARSEVAAVHSSAVVNEGCYSCRPEWGALNEKED